MPLPQQKLDDKTFDVLVGESLKLIPRHAPEWTDHNRHDPGITLVELFAWLTEMQQFYLDSIGPESYRKFLKLLGTKPYSAVPAQTEINFQSSGELVHVPRGTKLTNSSFAADKPLIFETNSSLEILPLKLKRILTSTSRGLKDNTGANDWDGLSYYAFGEEAESDSRLYLGFDRAFPAGKQIGLTFDLVEDYEVARGEHGAEDTLPLPSALIAWEYYNARKEWVALKITGDNTLMLSQSGRFFFTAPADMGSHEGLPLAEPNLFWLRATVRQAGFELAPKIDAISINTIDATQHDTLSETTSFSSAGTPKESIVADSYLALFGENVVQVRERDDRWMNWTAKTSLADSGPNDRHVEIHRDPAAGTVTLSFGDGKHGRMLVEGENRIRLISYLADFAEEQNFGSSNGLPNQSFSLERIQVLPDTLTIQVLELVTLPLTTVETKTVSCLFSFSRTITLKESKKIEVKISLTALTDLCDVVVVETVSHRGENENRPVEPPPFKLGRMRVGKTEEQTYSMDAIDSGDSIRGNISFTFASGCEPMKEESPVSLLDFTQSGKESRWRDWIQVDNFDGSGPGDPHFTFDPITSTVRFGDGINGDIPQAAVEEDGEPERNLRITSLKTCAAEDGNVAANTIKDFAASNLPPSLLKLGRSQVVAAKGGTAPETIADAQARARRDLRTQYQAVTSDDFELLAINTPGLRVARAKAIPCFSASGKDEKTSVTVVVLPYGTSAKPMPSQNFLLNICRHLDRHRLITTRVEVVPPNYVRVTVLVTVLPAPGFTVSTTRAAIIAALNRFLRPIHEPGDSENKGWPFGRTVFKSEIYECIEKVEGVDCVEKVSLTAEGVGAARDANGNITITRISVVFSGNHQVDVVTPELQCRSSA
jgi:Baseplate J-like protein